MKDLSPEEMLDKEIHDAKFRLWELLKVKGTRIMTDTEIEVFVRIYGDLFLPEVLE